MRWDFSICKSRRGSRFRSPKLVVPLVDDILCLKDLIYHKHFLNGRHMLVLVHLHTARTVDGLRMQIHNLPMHQQLKMRALRETIELSRRLFSSLDHPRYLQLNCHFHSKLEYLMISRRDGVCLSIEVHHLGLP